MTAVLIGGGALAAAAVGWIAYRAVIFLRFLKRSI